MYPNSQKKNKNITWKRAQEINPNARLFVDGINSRDIIQGDLGNCWLVAAFCTLTVHKKNWKKVIPNHEQQDWVNNSTGLFHFRFWRYGAWVDVVVDDYLPVRKGKLIFCHSPVRNEFWPALAEKAYAKLYGSYEALNGGELSEALEDFTGGVTESFELKDEGFRKNVERKEQFYDFLVQNMSRNSLLCAAIPALTIDQMEKRTKQGLVQGHAYAVTAILTIRTQAFDMNYPDPLPMVRLRNPWGGIEWNGAFSDGSKEWKAISNRERQMMGLVFKDDGEFWMTFDDFIKYYVTVALCHLVDTANHAEKAFHSAWRSPDLAGGCINFSDHFLNNPQFLLDIKNRSEDVLFHLLQKTLINPGDQRITIGFTIMQVENNRTERIRMLQKVIKSSVYRDGRSIFLQHGLLRGRYIVIPTTYEPDLQAPFLFRIYTSRSASARELNLGGMVDRGMRRYLPLMSSPPSAVTQVKVIRAEHLSREKGKNINPYCVLKCGNKQVVSLAEKETSCPQWDLSALFYRKKVPQEPISVEVWNKVFPMDELLGKQTFIAAEETNKQLLDMPLIIKTTQGGRLSNGRIYLGLTTSYDINMM